MKRIFRQLGIAGFFLVTVIAFQNCSKNGIAFKESDLASSEDINGINGGADDDGRTVGGDTGGAGGGTVGGDTGGTGGGSVGPDGVCDISMVSGSGIVKVLFLIDVTGSNTATDRDKVWRLNTLEAFLETYQSKPNFEFSFAVFQDYGARAILKNSAGQGIFSKQAADIDAAMNTLRGISDYGGTPYDAAIAITRNIINYDRVSQPTVQAGYVVVMISDGVPTNSTYIAEGTGMARLESDVKGLLSEAPGNITLNTVYLFNQNYPTASDKKYLQKISSLGGGAFVEASANEVLKVSEVVQIPSKVCK